VLSRTSLTVLIMSKISSVLIYRIPLSKIDKHKPQNKNNNLPCINAKNEFSVGLYFCSLIFKKDFGFINKKYIFNASGKPTLESEKYGFSISYTNDHAYIAIVRNDIIGLDAEQVNNIDLSVSKEFMSERELLKLKESTNKYGYFYRIWTLKESYVKLIGTGIDNTIADIELIEDKNGKFSLAKEVEQKVYFNSVVIKDCIISVATFNFMNYEIVDFASTKEFLNKYDH